MREVKGIASDIRVGCFLVFDLRDGHGIQQGHCLFEWDDRNILITNI